MAKSTEKNDELGNRAEVKGFFPSALSPRASLPVVATLRVPHTGAGEGALPPSIPQRQKIKS